MVVGVSIVPLRDVCYIFRARLLFKDRLIFRFVDEIIVHSLLLDPTFLYALLPDGVAAAAGVASLLQFQARFRDVFEHNLPGRG